MGASEVLYGSFEKLFSQMDGYAAVQRDQVRLAAGKYFTENNKTVGKLIPEGGAK